MSTTYLEQAIEATARRRCTDRRGLDGVPEAHRRAVMNEARSLVAVVEPFFADHYKALAHKEERERLESRTEQFVQEVREEVEHLQAQAAAGTHRPGSEANAADILADEVGSHVASKAALRLTGALERFDGKQEVAAIASQEPQEGCTFCRGLREEAPAVPERDCPVHGEPQEGAAMTDQTRTEAPGCQKHHHESCEERYVDALTAPDGPASPVLTDREMFLDIARRPGAITDTYRDRLRKLADRLASLTIEGDAPEVCERCGGSKEVLVSGSGNPYDEDPPVMGPCPDCTPPPAEVESRHQVADWQQRALEAEGALWDINEYDLEKRPQEIVDYALLGLPKRGASTTTGASPETEEG